MLIGLRTTGPRTTFILCSSWPMSCPSWFWPEWQQGQIAKLRSLRDTTTPCNSLRSADVFPVVGNTSALRRLPCKGCPCHPIQRDQETTRLTEDNLILPIFTCLAVWTSIMSNPLFSLQRSYSARTKINIAVDLFDWVITPLDRDQNADLLEGSLRSSWFEMFWKVTCFFTNNNLRTTKQRQAS